MASFLKHKAKNGTLSWRAQLSINGVRDSKGGFDSKSDAKIWAATREAQILSGCSALAPSENPIPYVATITSKTLGDVFERYAKEVSPTKVGYSPR